MIDVIMDDRGREYSFRFVTDADNPENVRIYVEKFPKKEALDYLMTRILGTVSPQKLGVPYYLGVSADYVPTNYQQAKTVASIWVTAFSQFLATGAPFDSNESD